MSKRPFPRPAVSCRFEQLEPRNLFSVVVWGNEGSDTNDSDNFNAIFGTDADLARADVRQAVNDWSAVIGTLNSPIPQITVDVSATGGSGFGANASFGDQYQGKPTDGSISLNTGTANRTDRGYYLDPHPEDDSEFRGNIVNAYAADAPVGSPAYGKYDLYTVVVLEMAHQLGLNDSGPELFTSDPNGYLTDTVQTDKSLVGELWAYDGPDVQALFTTDNALTQDLGSPVHTAEPSAGNQVTLDGVTYYGAQDSDNARFEISRRYLPSYLDALVLKDSYGYTVVPPSRNMYTTFDVTTGNLLIRGGQAGEGFYGGTTPSDDTITLGSHVTGAKSFTDATVQIGTPVLGTGPNIPLVSSFPSASVTSITVDGNDGSDFINVESSPAPVTIQGTSQGGATDTVFLGPSVSATFTAIPIGTGVQIQLGGDDAVTLDYSAASIDGAIALSAAGSTTGNSLHILGASATDSFTVNEGSVTHLDSVVTFDAASAAGLVLDTGAFSIPAGLNSGTSLTVAGQGTTNLTPGATLGTLDIDAAHVMLTGASGSVESVQDLQISNGGSLDLGLKSLQIPYATAPDPAARIRAYLQSPAILTSTATDASHGVALADSADGVIASLSSQSLLIRLAHYGDANLDGTVNFTDLLALAQHYGRANANWDQGDFTNDASVGFTDLLLLAQNYGRGANTVAAVSPLTAVAPAPTPTPDSLKKRPSRRW